MFYIDVHTAGTEAGCKDESELRKMIKERSMPDDPRSDDDTGAPTLYDGKPIQVWTGDVTGHREKHLLTSPKYFVT